MAEEKNNNRITLKKGFKYTHHPLEEKDMENFFYGREEVLAELKAYIKESRGGSILVTGFRGVGKTSLVNKAILDLQKDTKQQKYIKIYINLAQSIEPRTLMYHIIRQIIQSMGKKKINKDIKKKIKTVYQKTIESMTIEKIHKGSGALSGKVDL